MSIQYSVILLLTLIFLSGCAIEPTSSNLQAIPTATAKIKIATETSSMTYTLTTKSTSTIAPTFEQEKVLKHHCLDISNDLPSNITAKGQLVLEGVWAGERSYLLDFDQGKQVDLPPNARNFSTSPDGRWLAFGEKTNNGKWLVFQSSDGKERKEIPALDTWNFVMTWLSNEQVAMNIDQGNVLDILVSNPITGTQHNLRSDYPGLEPFGGAGGASNHFIYSSVVYDPSLRYVVYPQTTENIRWNVVLWDTQSRKELASIEDHSHFYMNPVWSEDGSQFYVAINRSPNPQKPIYELFRVSKVGKVTQLTHFGDHIESNDIKTISLSPDGGFLAFWLEIPGAPFADLGLAILNIETQEIVQTCISSPKGNFFRPGWSHDSRYLAVGKEYDDPTGAFQTILIDTKEMWAAQVADHVVPVGWLVKP